MLGRRYCLKHLIGGMNLSGVLKIKDKNTNEWIGVDAIKGDDGKSAYQQAVEGGFSGTEEEFAQGLIDLPNVTKCKFGTYTGTGYVRFVNLGYTPSAVMVTRSFVDINDKGTNADGTINDGTNGRGRQIYQGFCLKGEPLKQYYDSLSFGEIGYTYEFEATNALEITENGFLVFSSKACSELIALNDEGATYMYIAFE